MDYCILCHPGHNRVYFAESRHLALAEMRALAPRLEAGFEHCGHQALAGVEYLAFSTGGPLSPADCRRLARLSFFLALFQREGALLRPLAAALEGPIDPGIGAMLKYRGKTNERFTRMMINLAQWATALPGPHRLLDPVAGKGTTLFEAAALGLDAAGVELSPAVSLEAFQFFKRYLETAHCKHTVQTDSIGYEGGKAKRWSFAYAADKAAMKARPRELGLVAGDTAHAGRFFSKESFHLLVGDLPYGVAHGSVTDKGRRGITRSPKELLAAALPGWHRVLKPGGVLALSWNRFLLERAAMEELLAGQGFGPLAGPVYDNLAHRVDQAILRDVIIAARN